MSAADSLSLPAAQAASPAPDENPAAADGARAPAATIVEAPRQVSDRRKWLILVIACLAQFMVVLDATIVNVALPSIQRGLQLLRRQPAVGGQRLHARLRRLPAARRAGWLTCSAASACSSPAWRCSHSPRC